MNPFDGSIVQHHKQKISGYRAADGDCMCRSIPPWAGLLKKVWRCGPTKVDHQRPQTAHPCFALSLMLTFHGEKQVLKFLPLMIGWFSLSVPSALGLYWILNNFISTGTSVFIRNQVGTKGGTERALAGGGLGGGVVVWVVMTRRLFLIYICKAVLVGAADARGCPTFRVRPLFALFFVVSPHLCFRGVGVLLCGRSWRVFFRVDMAGFCFVYLRATDYR